MCTGHSREDGPPSPRRLFERLDALPLRPATARFVLADLPEDPSDAPPDPAATARRRAVTDLDPGWAVATARVAGSDDPMRVVAGLAWWPTTSREGGDALTRLWRHSVAVGLAARRLAREADDPEADRVAAAGFLHGLGLWAAASLDPEWLARWLQSTDAEGRRDLERRDLGTEAGALGRVLAERWGCGTLSADAAWLLGDGNHGLEHAADDPRRVALLRQAYRLAERTPWALATSGPRESGQHDPRVKALMAETQSRCPGPFLDADATPREERLTRSNARLRLAVFTLASERAAGDRLLSSLAATDPAEGPESWAERAGLAFCAEPGVSAARVSWVQAGGTSPGLPTAGDTPPPAGRPPSLVVPLASRGETFATVGLWPSGEATAARPPGEPAWSAWRSWGAMVADRARTEARLARVHLAFQRQAEGEDQRVRAAKLDALAEFAAGAGHELNNPLAVIVGRAQLLMVGQTDPKMLRSLRAILAQAQRAHRILRDLMYVARPPEPRPRFCQPDEIVRASVRDARLDAEDRDVRVEALDHGVRVWADPDGLRHLADILLRNALEATPKGGQVRFATGGDAATLRWTVHDTGRGITPADGAHLFDPFYCGRQAGRGLGMGLPRAARFVGQSGGEIRWHSTPGQGSTFHVRLPLTEPPGPVLPAAEVPPAASPAAGGKGASA